MFNPLYFDLWWHEDEKINGITDMAEYVKNHRSFFIILEELNR